MREREVYLLLKFPFEIFFFLVLREGVFWDGFSGGRVLVSFLAVCSKLGARKKFLEKGRVILYGSC